MRRVDAIDVGLAAAQNGADVRRMDGAALPGGGAGTRRFRGYRGSLTAHGRHECFSPAGSADPPGGAVSGRAPRRASFQT